MENFIEEINQIMKPYYEYTEKNKVKNQNIINEIANVRKEISEIENNSEDTESKKIDLLKGKLHSLMEEFDKNIKYRRVYVKEMIEIKNSIINKLTNRKNGILEFQNNLKKQALEKLKTIAEIENENIINRKKLEHELHELNEQVSSFVYEYDENNECINESEINKLFNKINMVLDKLKNIGNSKSSTTEIDELTKKINFLEEKIKIINDKESEITLSKEELKINTITLSKLEQDEYDRRKGIKVVDEEELYFEDGIPVIEEYHIPSNTLYEPISFNNQFIENVSKKENPKQVGQNNIIPYDLGDSIDFKVSIRGNSIIVKNNDDLCNQIYLDIMDNFENMNSVKIDDKTNFNTKDNSYNLNINLKYKVNDILSKGEYLNLKDIETALDKFYIKEKDRNYCLNGEIYKLSYNKFKKLRNKINKCSMIAFIKYKKHKKNNEYSLYGKTSSDKDLSYMDEINIDIKEGFYVNKEDFIKILNIILKQEKKMSNNSNETKFKIR